MATASHGKIPSWAYLYRTAHLSLAACSWSSCRGCRGCRGCNLCRGCRGCSRRVCLGLLLRTCKCVSMVVVCMSPPGSPVPNSPKRNLSMFFKFDDLCTVHFRGFDDDKLACFLLKPSVKEAASQVCFPSFLCLQVPLQVPSQILQTGCLKAQHHIDN